MEMMNDRVQLFEDQPIRTAWIEDEEEWYFSIVDVVGVLSESKDPTSYWRKLKQRLKEEGNETVTNCHALKRCIAIIMILIELWDFKKVKPCEN